VFLHNNNEIKIPGILGGVLELDEKYSSQNPSDLFVHYDVIKVDISKYKEWYAQHRNTIANQATYKSIFIHPSHAPVSESLKKKLTEVWRVDSVIKEFPEQFANKADLINKILSGHLASLDLNAEEAVSCCVSLYQALKSLSK
jgi:hypothetical protein